MSQGISLSSNSIKLNLSKQTNFLEVLKYITGLIEMQFLPDTWMDLIGWDMDLIKMLSKLPLIPRNFLIVRESKTFFKDRFKWAAK